MDLASALDYVRDHAIDMLTAPGSNLTAVAVSSKDHGPITETKDFTVTAYVERKLSTKEMNKLSVKPFNPAFVHAFGGPKPKKADIDVVETGTPFRTLNNPGLTVPIAQHGVFGGMPAVVDTQKYFKALRSGIGIANPDGDYPTVPGGPTSLSVGTLGFFVETPNGDIHLVSNNHVIGKSADKVAGAAGVIGNPVVQPGTLDLTSVELILMPTLATLVAPLQIATVSGVVLLDFKTAAGTPHNFVDAAAAKLTAPNSRLLSDLGRVSFGGRILGTGVYQPDPADPNRVVGDPRVYKVGRTTGYTEGKVTALAGTSSIPYPGGIAFFINQLVIEATADNVGPFSSPGDSGSGILNAGHQLVGLLFAGTDSHTLANPIDEVLTKLATALGVPVLNLVTK